MAKRTIENCTVAKRNARFGPRDGSNVAITSNLGNGVLVCEGYQRSEYDDEPTDECAACPLCALYDEESMFALRKGMGC